MASSEFLGRAVWIEMDTDRSAVNFSPRKGIVTKVFSRVPKKEGATVELVPAPLVFYPLPGRLRTIVLQYHSMDEASLSQTFRLGISYAEVLRPRGRTVLGKEELREDDIRQIGFASVSPWPVPDTEQIRKRLAEHEGRS